MPRLDDYAARLSGNAAGSNRILCPGPGHSRRDRSLSVTFNADGTFAVHSFSGDDFRDCRDHVKACLGLSDERPIAFNDNTPDVDVAALRKRQDDALAVWERSKPIAGTLAERYLASRGLNYDGAELRFWRGGRAMIAQITDALSGEFCGIHRTFLTADGRKRGRKMLGRARGGVVRLYEPSAGLEGIGIAEGIETALATNHAPLWACLSAGTMASLPVVPSFRSLTVYADHDTAGFDAANAVGRRWHAAGRAVTILAPERGDFADFGANFNG